MKSKGIQEEAANEIAEIFNEIISDEIATKRDLAETKVEIIKWVAGMLVGQAALITALIKLL